MAAGGWRLQHPAAVRPLYVGVSPPHWSQVLNVGCCCLFASWVMVSLMLFWKSTAPSRDSGASKLSPELFGGALFFLLSLMQAVPVWGQSVAAWGAEVQDKQSCVPSAGNYQQVAQAQKAPGHSVSGEASEGSHAPVGVLSLLYEPHCAFMPSLFCGCQLIPALSGSGEAGRSTAETRLWRCSASHKPRSQCSERCTLKDQAPEMTWESREWDRDASLTV